MKSIKNLCNKWLGHKKEKVFREMKGAGMILNKGNHLTQEDLKQGKVFRRLLDNFPIDKLPPILTRRKSNILRTEAILHEF